MTYLLFVLNKYHLNLSFIFFAHQIECTSSIIQKVNKTISELAQIRNKVVTYVFKSHHYTHIS